MISSVLPEPLDFSQCLTYEDQRKIAYDYFCENIKSQECREKLKGKEIKINLKKPYLDAKEECFEHLVGFDEIDKYSITPCTNLSIQTQCINSCNLINIPPGQRILCLYRARLLPWLNEIIKLANNDSPYVKYWEKEKIDLKTRRIEKIAYIRFQEGIADYLIVFRVYPDGNYYLLSAYPLVLRKLRETCDKEYENYIDSK